MNKTKAQCIFTVLIFCITCFSPLTVSADHLKWMMGPGDYCMTDPGMMSRAPYDKGYSNPSEGMHQSGSHWRTTLTDDQKRIIDEMHFALRKDRNVVKAEMRLRETELNNLIVEDNVDMDAINRKIDEVVELKRAIMQKQFEHMAEIRAVLTPEQRVSFDRGIFWRGHCGHKRGHCGHKRGHCEHKRDHCEDKRDHREHKRDHWS